MTFRVIHHFNSVYISLNMQLTKLLLLTQAATFKFSFIYKITSISLLMIIKLSLQSGSFQQVSEMVVRGVMCSRLS